MQLRKEHKHPKFPIWKWNERDEITQRVCLKKGTPRAKFVGYFKDDKREYFFHATKGIRSQSL